MSKWINLIWFGFLVWLIPFIFSLIIYPFKNKGEIFFNNLSIIVITIVFIAFLTAYISSTTSFGWKRGLFLGLCWFGISLGFDLIVFIWGPYKMPILEYFTQRGVNYVVYPIISSAFGRVSNQNN